MNTPNKLTIVRMVLIPFFVLFLLADLSIPGQRYIALAFFIIASVTDYFDGYLARKHNLVTNFGKFMDPLADKILICSALCCFIELKLMPTWIVIVIIAREFIISGFRLVAAGEGIVIAASIWGKIKTAWTMVTIIILLLKIPGFYIIEQISIYAAFALTLISLIDYIYKNRAVF